MHGPISRANLETQPYLTQAPQPGIRRQEGKKVEVDFQRRKGRKY
jgi:hypothetical protein